MRHLPAIFCALFSGALAAAGAAHASRLPDHAEVSAALATVTAAGVDNGGLFSPNRMWAAVVDRSGRVRVVTKTAGRDPWPGSRVIAMQKAFTANAFSSRALALSTANLFSPVQPGNSLFGLQFSNPLNARAAYAGPAAEYGSAHDPATTGNTRIGGVTVFGGGLPLYDQDSGEVLGAIGVSGDASCTDHVIAWRLRQELGFSRVPAGVNHAAYGGAQAPPGGDDNIVYDLRESADGELRSASGYGHPRCGARSRAIDDLRAMQNF